MKTVKTSTKSDYENMVALDVCCSVQAGSNPFIAIKKWLIGEHSHVFIYLGVLDLCGMYVDWLAESNGRGVMMQPVSARNDEMVDVYRFKVPEGESIHDYYHKIIEVLAKLLSNQNSYYDYLSIVRFVVPQAILRKLHLEKFIPLAWQRDSFQICSEFVYELFYQAGLGNILPNSNPDTNAIPQIPLPSDFANSPMLEYIGRFTVDGG